MNPLLRGASASHLEGRRCLPKLSVVAPKNNNQNSNLGLITNFSE